MHKTNACWVDVQMVRETHQDLSLMTQPAVRTYLFSLIKIRSLWSLVKIISCMTDLSHLYFRNSLKASFIVRPNRAARSRHHWLDTISPFKRPLSGIIPSASRALRYLSPPSPMQTVHKRRSTTFQRSCCPRGLLPIHPMSSTTLVVVVDRVARARPRPVTKPPNPMAIEDQKA